MVMVKKFQNSFNGHKISYQCCELSPNVTLLAKEASQVEGAWIID